MVKFIEEMSPVYKIEQSNKIVLETKDKMAAEMFFVRAYNRISDILKIVYRRDQSGGWHHFFVVDACEGKLMNNYPIDLKSALDLIEEERSIRDKCEEQSVRDKCEEQSVRDKCDKDGVKPKKIQRYSPSRKVEPS